MSNTTKNLWDSYNGKGFAAKTSDYAKRASADVNGNSLELTVEGDSITEIGGKTISAENQIPVPQEDDKLLISDSGNASWKQLLKSSWGTVIMAGDNALADENGNLIFDENETELWTSFNNVGFGAERAIADVEGNDIIDTYAKKNEIPVVPDMSQYQRKLTPDTVEATSTVNVDNNRVTSITIGSESSISAMTVNCVVADGECANLAVEIDNQSSTDCTITVVKNNVANSMRKAESVTDAKVKSGKFCQVTCVGSCWTLAEFAIPT